jgi:hypothetical protein
MGVCGKKNVEGKKRFKTGNSTRNSGWEETCRA